MSLSSSRRIDEIANFLEVINLLSDTPSTGIPASQHNIAIDLEGATVKR